MALDYWTLASEQEFDFCLTIPEEAAKINCALALFGKPSALGFKEKLIADGRWPLNPKSFVAAGSALPGSSTTSAQAAQALLDQMTNVHAKLTPAAGAPPQTQAASIGGFDLATYLPYILGAIALILLIRRK